MSKRIKRLAVVVSIVLLIGEVLAFVIVRFVPQKNPSLLTSARKRVSEPLFNIQAGWVANHEILFLTNSQDAMDIMQVIDLNTDRQTSLYRQTGDQLLSTLNAVKTNKDRFSRVDWSSVNPVTHVRLTSHLFRQLPRNAKIFESAISPKQDRRAWNVNFSSQPLPNWDRMVVSGSLLKPNKTTGLWITKMDGPEPKCVGVLPDGSDDQKDITGKEWIYFISWSPDGKLLSFTYQGSLWTVAAPKMG